MKKPRIAFFGTPHFVTHVLDALDDAGLAPSIIVTQPDRPADRGLLPKASPVKEWAVTHHIPVLTPEKLDADFLSSLKATSSELQPSFDIFIVAGYGKILPKELLALPTRGTLNVHPSLLPKYRGSSPIETQILDDAAEVGVSVILLDNEMDHGPILAQKSFRPSGWPLSRSALETLLWQEGGTVLATAIPPYIEGGLKPYEQNHAQATATQKLTKDNGLLNLSEDARGNYLKFLAYEGWPSTYFFANRNGKNVRVKVTDAVFENGEFKILHVIPEGKKEMAYSDFLRN